VKNLYSEDEARTFCERYSSSERYASSGEDLALRVYTSRLIGGEPRLVMHGGGNTSVKSMFTNLLGDEIEAIYVKGSGWNLDSIEPPGFPALDLPYLRRLRALARLSDEEMVNELRTHLFDAGAPNPSVETLLHAFLPYKFVDHSHAEAILTLTNQPHGEELVAEVFADELAPVPYVMPGFELARVAAAVADQHPKSVGLVLHRHGLFTWGETARESYDRHIEMVSRAEAFIAARSGGRRAVAVSAYDEETARHEAAPLAPVLRGALTAADPEHRRWIVELRLSPLIRSTVCSPEVEELLLGAPLTPDHVIRTKERPLVLPAPSGDPSSWRPAVDQALTAYVAAYDTYFRANVERTGRHLTELDPLPRVVVVKDHGLFFVGSSIIDARIAGDLYQATIDVKTVAPLLGRYEGLSSADLFDVEYWSLEQAKLSKTKEKALQRKVALVTGAGGAIGTAVVRHLALDGACVLACDLDGAAAARAADAANRAARAERCRAIVADVTDERSVADAFLEAAAAFGGVDLVVLNAGIALSAPIEEITLDEWQRVLDVNLTGYFTTLREAVRWLKLQGTGGHVIVNASKNVFAPGAELAAYSASKAGGHQLGKLAAIELAPAGIRVNMINADAVFADGEVPSGLWVEVGPGRARARGLDPAALEDYYRERNLLKTRVTADDVARAVLFFAREETPTTGATLPVDGGIAAAFPR
jgi:rhamnulose-1-phosphate aldolase/alcohol dehydrogenase